MVLLSFFLSLLFAVTVKCQDEHVVVLTPDNFDSVIDGSKPALVEFYAPWCGHCKNLEPNYNELANAYSYQKSSVIIAKVDADAHGALGARFGVQGFPTLKWFSKGSTEPEEYQGGRTFEDLSKFVEERTGIPPKIKSIPTAVTVLDDSNFDSIVLNTTLNVLVEFYAPWCGHCKALDPIYKKAASVFSSEPTCVLANIDADKYGNIGSQYGIQGFPTLKFFGADGKDAPIDYDKGRSLDDLVSFMNEHCGTKRDKEGKLTEEAGLIKEAKEIYESAGKAPAASLLEKFNKLSSSIKPDPYGDLSIPYHTRILEKSVENSGYVEKELARIERLLSKEGNAVSAKLDNLVLRRNILSAFATNYADNKGHDEL